MAAPNDFAYYTPGAYKDPYTGQSWSDTTYGDQAREAAPQAAYYSWLAGLGIPDNNSAFSNWVRQQYPQVYQGYQAATIDNPYLLINPYLQSLGGYQDWLRRFQNQAPQLRGENQSAAGAGVVRVLGR